MNSVRTSLLWSMLERYLGLMVTLTSTMILARLLTPAQVGVFSMCAALVAIASIIREFGVSEYIIQARELDEAKLRQAYGVAILTAWPVGALIFLVRDLLAGFYQQPEMASVIGVMAVNFLVLPVATPSYAVLMREMRFRQALQIQLSAAVVGAIVSVLLAHVGLGPLSLAWGTVATNVAQVLGIMAIRPQSARLLPAFRGNGHILRFGSYLVSSKIMESAAGNLHEFLIAHHFGFTSVGIFSRAKGLIDMFYANVTSAVGRVATPDMAAGHRENRSLTHTFARGTAILTSLSWTFFSFVSLAADEIVVLLFGQQWVAAGRIASILALAVLPSTLASLGTSVLAAMGEAQRRLSITSRWAPVHIAVVLLGVPFGLEIFAGAWALSSFTLSFLYAREIRQLLRASYRELFGPCLLSALVASACAALQFATLHACRAAQLPTLVSLTAAGLATLIAWILITRLCGHTAGAEVDRVLSTLIQRFRRA